MELVPMAEFTIVSDFLASRGRAGDAEKALGHYERSLEVREVSVTRRPTVRDSVNVVDDFYDIYA